MAIVALGVGDGHEVAVRRHLGVGQDLKGILDRGPRTFERLEMLRPVRVGLGEDCVCDVTADFGGMCHQAFGALEALVIEEVLESEVSGRVGEVTTGLEHHEGDEAPVGSGEAANGGVDGEVGWGVERGRWHCLPREGGSAQGQGDGPCADAHE